MTIGNLLTVEKREGYFCLRFRTDSSNERKGILASSREILKSHGFYKKFLRNVYVNNGARVEISVTSQKSGDIPSFSLDGYTDFVYIAIYGNSDESREVSDKMRGLVSLLF